MEQNRIEEIRERCDVTTRTIELSKIRSAAPKFFCEMTNTETVYNVTTSFDSLVAQVLEPLCSDIVFLLSEVERLTAELEAYKQKERDGLLVGLPCKSGDIIYQLRGKKHAHGAGVAARRVSCASVWGDGDYELHHQGQTPCRKSDLGVTWFLTEQAAIEAMEKEGE